MAIFTNSGDDPIFNPLAPPFYGDSDLVQYGLDGNDTLAPTWPSYTYYLDGGRGDDTIVANAASGDVAIGGEGDDTISNVAGNNDFLSGGSGDDQVTGGAQVDLIEGNGDDDVLDGGFGNDTLDGGRGLDKFQFSTALDAANNIDTIDDFKSADDQIVLDVTIFTELAPGALAKKAFFVGKKAHDSNDLIIYNVKSGTIQYDADSKGGDKGVVFAVLDKGTVLSAGDFELVA